MSERKRGFICYAVAIDMDAATDGDFNDFRRALDALEADFAGVHLLGTEGTDTWPSFSFRNADGSTPRSLTTTGYGVRVADMPPEAQAEMRALFNKQSPTCPYCGGNGHDGGNAASDKPCAGCDGTGRALYPESER
jgi:hypothetical protein